MATKRQTTMAKLAREQAVREKRVRKQQRKEERKAAAALGVGSDGEPLDGFVIDAGDDQSDDELAVADDAKPVVAASAE